MEGNWVTSQRQLACPGDDDLVAAIRRGDVEEVRRLADGADICPEPDRGTVQDSALHVAVQLGNEEVVRILLVAGADTEARDLDETTPLLHAAERGDVAVIKLLLGAGADVTARNRGGGTPLHVCVQRRDNEEVVGLLLDAGAAVSATDAAGLTALHVACAGRSHERTVRLLLAAGASVESPEGRDGSTPLHIAAGRGDYKVLFFFTLVTGLRRSLSLKLSDTTVYEPQIRARLPLQGGEDSSVSGSRRRSKGRPRRYRAAYRCFFFFFITLEPRVE